MLMTKFSAFCCPGYIYIATLISWQIVLLDSDTDLAKQKGLTVNTGIYYCEYCGPLLYQNVNIFLKTSKLLWMLNDNIN